MATSVLRIEDQRAGRFPDVCVLTGAPTSNAVRLRAVDWSGRPWLLGVPGAVAVLRVWPGRASVPVALPMTPRAWGMWRRRNTIAIAALTFGLGFVLVGAIGARSDIAAIGTLVVLAASAYRTRAAAIYWVMCRYDPERGTVVVKPAHSQFDQQARALFARSVR